TILGPVIGAFMLIGLESYLSSGVTVAGINFGPEWVPVITGAIFVICVLAFRRGVVGEIAAWYARRRSR
ncbi:MAG: branched-chain amino acid ABC transporter permease, partial [Casimicrobiaceae bacterium]